MPIPFLIGGLVAAAAAAAAYAFSDDDKPCSSGSSSDSDEAKHSRRRAAENEHTERERTQKQEAAHQDFRKQGRAFGTSLAQALPSDLVKASGAFALDFDLKKRSMQFNMKEASARDADLLATIDGLETILTKRASHQKTIDNLATFSELFKPKFQCGEVLRKMQKQAKRIDDDLEKLKKVKIQLMKLENETASVQVQKDEIL